jgi:hypothetical protein
LRTSFVKARARFMSDFSRSCIMVWASEIRLKRI